MCGGHRGLSANHDGYRAVLGQPRRHFARSLHGAGGWLYIDMAAQIYVSAPIDMAALHRMAPHLRSNLGQVANT